MPQPVRVPLHTQPLGILGSLSAGRRNVLELIPEIATHAPILSGRTGKRWHMVMDPDALRRILRDKVEDYPKSDVTKLILGPAIGNSLFVAEGEAWLWQRRTAAPVFSHRNVAALAPVMSAAADRSSARIAAAFAKAALIDADYTSTTVDKPLEQTAGGLFTRTAITMTMQHNRVAFFTVERGRLEYGKSNGVPAGRLQVDTVHTTTRAGLLRIGAARWGVEFAWGCGVIGVGGIGQ